MVENHILMLRFFTIFSHKSVQGLSFRPQALQSPIPISATKKYWSWRHKLCPTSITRSAIIEAVNYNVLPSTIPRLGNLAMKRKILLPELQIKNLLGRKFRLKTDSDVWIFAIFGHDLHKASPVNPRLLNPQSQIEQWRKSEAGATNSIQIPSQGVQ